MDAAFIVSTVCADHGAVLTWGIGLLAASGVASVAANFESKMPPWLRSVVHVAALNFFALAKQTAGASQPKG